ncbi:MAG: prepilin-type N-terminal cleavage/methylation domain-containing protein [Deltaproteobacteria bacterium]|nr:prepilin-type N-terminal cleavage/methylation domain-containing protein [Candidatus Deferrimicrobium borealis]
MKDRRGFTLIEIMIAFAIVGIVAVITVTNFQSWVYKYNFSGFQREVLSSLKQARTLSVSSQRQHRVIFDLDNAAVTLSRGDRGINSTSWTPVPGNVRASFGGRIGSVTPTPGVATTSGTFALIFNPSSEVLQGNPTVSPVTQADIGLTGRNPGDVATIRVYGWTGKARIQ